jgi:hypothetical protein
VRAERLTGDSDAYHDGKQVVMGIQISDSPYCSRIDVEDAAHEQRLEQTKDLEGAKAYYLIAQA